MAEQETNPVEMKETETVPMDAQAARKIEQDKLSRRQALRKFGFGAGFAALALLGVDDLARMVGKRMEQMAGDNKIAEQIAHEFREAGVAFASSSGTPDCYQCVADKENGYVDCTDIAMKTVEACTTQACINKAQTDMASCQDEVEANYILCCNVYNCNC